MRHLLLLPFIYKVRDCGFHPGGDHDPDVGTGCGNFSNPESNQVEITTLEDAVVGMVDPHTVHLLVLFIDGLVLFSLGNSVFAGILRCVGGREEWRQRYFHEFLSDPGVVAIFIISL